ncbi:MAG: CoA transferase [Solirubrobacterales bacterium]
MSDRVEVWNQGVYLPSRFDVDGLATLAVSAAAAGAAEFLAARNGEALLDLHLDARQASAAFVSERLFAPDGWELPGPWDPIAGDYAAGERWIRLHTNYAHHRDAVLRVLACANDRESVASALAGRDPAALEAEIVEAGGCAAVMYSRDEWLQSEQGAASAGEPVVRLHEHEVGYAGSGAADRPYAGIRVLDLTRVIAGPVCTRYLAAYGADVLRLDPPGFVEVEALLPETTTGKRCAFLDLAAPAGRGTFAELIEGADVLVSGLRPGALERLGLGQEELSAINPSLITARLDAYGWDGPWRRRRGFDSLVQMSCGIAATEEGPDPLPAQALDHATGYFLAGSVGQALARRERGGLVAEISASLIGTANRLFELGDPADPEGMPETLGGHDTELTSTHWGPASRVPVPNAIIGVDPSFAFPSGPLGRHEPRWTDRT